MHAAIDFGISNTDCVARVNGALRRWTQSYVGQPDAEQVRRILAAGDIALDDLPALVVTGGRHRLLPDTLSATRVVRVNETEAIGSGGQSALPHVSRRKRILVVSAGSGTALIAAQGKRYRHVTGTAVGGGTMLGLGRLILETADPVEIDALAMAGNSNAVDLSLADVITGPIGTLPASATAVNFGRLAREPLDARCEDKAAALVTLVGQVIALLAISAARAEKADPIVVIGHMTDMQSIRRVIDLVGQYYSTPITVPQDGGYFTALGALDYAARNGLT
jgi:type II pantothenate kinase